MVINETCPQNDGEEFTIYLFNAKDHVRYPVIKNYFDLSDEEIYKSIHNEFKILKQILSSKGVSYDNLQGALLPNQEKGKFETCFIFDSSQMQKDGYGYTIFSILLPLLDKDSTYSILCGEYVDILTDIPDSQFRLRSVMNDVITRCHSSKFQCSQQYFLVYCNRLTGPQRWHIVEELLKYPWFTGFADLTRRSPFKTYISCILTHSFIKCRRQIIAAHPFDMPDEENINLLGYPFQENHFTFVSINEDLFAQFLSYKIEMDVPDETDIGFSFNSLFPKFDSFSKLKLKIDDTKWYDYLIKKEGKGRKGCLLETLGYGVEDKNRFMREVYKKICSCYIYKLSCKVYDKKPSWKFCVCVEMPTQHGNERKTTVVLKYLPDVGEMYIITIT